MRTREIKYDVNHVLLRKHAWLQKKIMIQLKPCPIIRVAMAEEMYELFGTPKLMERGAYVEHLAKLLDDFIIEAYLAQRELNFVLGPGADVDPRFFGSTIEWFKQVIMSGASQGVTFTEVLNAKPQDRYFGTFAVVTELLVFFPYNLMYHTGGSMHDQYASHLSKGALHNILHTTFKLIVEDGLDVNQADYYERTPLQQVLMYSADAIRLSMPDHLVGFLPSFCKLFKHGSKIVELQQAGVRAWLRRKKERRSVKLIEDWWFEVVNNPFTACGERMLHRRATKWASAYVV
jgi:hypothetical protein